MKAFCGLLIRELLIIRRRLPRLLASWTVTPVLYMLAFGWGMGRGLSQEGLPYMAFLIPGLMAMSSMNQSFAISSELNVARFYWKIFDHFQCSPVPFTTIAAAEVAAACLRGLLSALIIAGIALFFGIRMKLGILLLVGLVLNSLIFGALGVAAAMLIRGHSDQIILANFIITPMSFFCGTVFSLGSVPAAVRNMIELLPLTFSARVIRASAFGQDVSALDILALAIFAVAAFTFAVRSVSKSRN